MKRHLLLGLLLLITLAGCNKTDPAVGSWAAKSGITLDVKDDKTFAIPAQQLAGTWTPSDNKIQMTVATIGGKSVDQFLKEAEQRARSTPGMSKDVVDLQLKRARDMLDQLSLTVSQDGKTATLNSAAGPSTLTKQESK